MSTSQPPPPAACAKHKDVPTQVQRATGPACAWCLVADLTAQLAAANQQVVEMELIVARLESAAGLGARR